MRLAICASAKKNPSDAGPLRLPKVADLYPKLINLCFDETNTELSCSLANALEKQSLFVNTAVTLYAWNLGKAVPLMIDSAIWQRMGHRA